MLLLCGNALIALGQDTIRMKDGRMTLAKISIVGTNDITYKLFNDQNGPTFITLKNEIDKIVLQSGTIINTQELNRSTTRKTISSAIYVLDLKKNAFKWEILSLATNDICFGYERSIIRNQSVEFKIAYIGIGERSYSSNNTFENTKGYFLKLGYKLVFPKSGDKNSMIGSYIKPEICYTQFRENFVNYKSKYAMLNFGVQSVLGSTFILEFYGGIGVAYNESDQNVSLLYPNYYDTYRSYYYSNVSEGGLNQYNTSLSGGMVLSYHF